MASSGTQEHKAFLQPSLLHLNDKMVSMQGKHSAGNLRLYLHDKSDCPTALWSFVEISQPPSSRALGIVPRHRLFLGSTATQAYKSHIVRLAAAASTCSLRHCCPWARLLPLLRTWPASDPKVIGFVQNTVIVEGPYMVLRGPGEMQGWAVMR